MRGRREGDKVGLLGGAGMEAEGEGGATGKDTRTSPGCYLPEKRVRTETTGSRGSILLFRW